MTIRMALIENGAVENIVLAPEGWEAPTLTVELPEGSPVSIGWLYDGESFAEPVAEPVTGPLLPIDFMRRFTMGEWVAIDNARANDGTVRYVMAQFGAAQSVRLDHPDVTAALAYFVYAGLLTQARADEIGA